MELADGRQELTLPLIGYSSGRGGAAADAAAAARQQEVVRKCERSESSKIVSKGQGSASNSRLGTHKGRSCSSTCCSRSTGRCRACWRSWGSWGVRTSVGELIGSTGQPHKIMVDRWNPAQRRRRAKGARLAGARARSTSFSRCGLWSRDNTGKREHWARKCKSDRMGRWSGPRWLLAEQLRAVGDRKSVV